MKKLTTFSEANKKQTGKKTTFQMNCPIINLWNKQTVLRRNFFQWKASRNSSWVKSKKSGNAKKTKYDINVSFESPGFLGEVG